MIFSKQKLDKAFTYMSKYYNKIILIDLDKDEYEPIKINDNEWKTLTELNSMKFSEWIAGFFGSRFYSCKMDNDHIVRSIMVLRDIEKLRQEKTPITIEYRKVIDGYFHDVMLEYIPCDNGKALLFVKDLYLMEKGIYENEV